MSIACSYISRLVALFAFTCVLLISSPSLAQRPSSSRYSLAVDEVTLTGGKRIYGIVMSQDANGLAIMVERSWFEKTYPKSYAAHVKAEAESNIASQTKHLFRLESWWKSRTDDTELVTFIDTEMVRIEKERDALKANNSDLKPFTVVTYPANEIRNVHIQSPAHHRMAGLAWKHKLDRVSSRSVTSIKRKLEELKVDTTAETFDLSSQLQSGRDQSESEWNARKAIIEYKLRSQLEFQGMDSNLIRIEPDQPAGQQADIQALMTQFMGSGLAGGGQVEELLKELGLGATKKTENKWWKKAAETAEAEGYSGFKVTRVIRKIYGPTATVECSLFAQVKPGEWKQVIRLTASTNLSDVRQADVDRIKQDPQIKNVLGLLKGLGSDDIIDKAIRQGAATETALSEARNKFDEFLERYTSRTDGPALMIK